MSAAVRKAFDARIKSVDVQKKTIDVVFSHETIDRDGEIILLSSWEKRLDVYRGNPLVLWQHPLGEGWLGTGAPDPDRLLGKALSVKVDPEIGLWGTLQYAVDENPKAKMVFDLLAGEYLRSYSIGAISHACVYADFPEVYLSLLPQFAQDALKSGEAWCVHTDMELLELSNVFVGSNREALARACRDGVISKSAMPELFAQITTGRPRLVVPKDFKEDAMTDAQFDTLKALMGDLIGKVVDLTAAFKASSETPEVADAADSEPEPEVEEAPATDEPSEEAGAEEADAPAEPAAPEMDVSAVEAALYAAVLSKL